LVLSLSSLSLERNGNGEMITFDFCDLHPAFCGIDFRLAKAEIILVAALLFWYFKLKGGKR
jgi:hypothetical protein